MSYEPWSPNQNTQPTNYRGAATSNLFGDSQPQHSAGKAIVTGLAAGALLSYLTDPGTPEGRAIQFRWGLGFVVALVLIFVGVYMFSVTPQKQRMADWDAKFNACYSQYLAQNPGEETPAADYCNALLGPRPYLGQH